jgi:hypothetical protein
VVQVQCWPGGLTRCTRCRPCACFDLRRLCDCPALPQVREQLNMKIYVDTDDDVRLARRIQVSCGAWSGSQQAPSAPCLSPEPPSPSLTFSSLVS